MMLWFIVLVNDLGTSAAVQEGVTQAVIVDEQANINVTDLEDEQGTIVREPIFGVSDFNIMFESTAAAETIEPEQLLDQPVQLTMVDGVYTRIHPGAAVVEIRLSDFRDSQLHRFDVTGLKAIIDDLLLYLNEEQKLVGVVVAPHPSDIDAQNIDRRGDRTDLTFLIRTATTSRIRTLASGDRVDLDQRENNDKHRYIREHSPFQPSTESMPGSLLRRDQLDNYLFWLNRHPGRRVDVAVSAGRKPDEVSLDFLVAESKPWYAYFQLSNTGTDSTGEIRERFGYVNNQLTDNDDILSIDYVTSGFSDSHVVSLNYERPLLHRWKLRLNGLYSEFAADQVGSPLDFAGRDVTFGGAIVINLFQHQALFIDAVTGFEFFYTSADNPASGLKGQETFLLGDLGIEIERITDTSQTRGSFTLTGNLTEGDATEMAILGRTSADTHFAFLELALSHSFYLEPLLDRDAWEDISDPSTSTLAHEISIGVRAQTSFDFRLAPTFQTVAGGLHSVRGYNQSAVSGDNSLILTAEYRFHLPRIFGIQDPQEIPILNSPFRFAPQSIYGRPDWDLVFKGFVDYARVSVNDSLPFEANESLLGVGVGIEVNFKDNISFRGDWGFALEDAGTVEAGDSEFHFVLSLLY